MIQSMTGFGSASKKSATHAYLIEIKSVNSRFVDTRIQGLKSDIKTEHHFEGLIKKTFKRGKFDVLVQIDSLSTNPSKEIPLDQIEKTWMKLETLRKKLKISQPLSLEAALMLPLGEKVHQSEGQHEQHIHELFVEALHKLTLSRQREGNVLAKDVRLRCRKLLGDLKKLKKSSQKSLKTKTQMQADRIESLLQDYKVDEHRLYQEMLLQLEKNNISEEITRLYSHIEYMLRRLGESVEKSLGRELDFMIQEIHRELNTVGAKVHDGELAVYVVDMKMELEKIREQVQNLE